MKALVCGVTGQDGSYLAELLLKKGYEVWGTSRDVATHPLGNLKFLGISKRVRLTSMAPNDFRSVLTAIDRSDADEIYYLAGQSSVGLSYEQPTETMESIATSILNLLEVIRIRKKFVRLYNAGSSECLGDTGALRADERTPFHPRSPYAVAKASAHWLVANYRDAYGIFASNGILFNHESPLRPERFVTQKIVRAAKRIAAGSPERLQLGRLDICRDWGWAPEYVEAMWRVLQHDKPDDFIIATGHTHSLGEFAAEAFGIHNLDWQEHVEANADLCRPLDIAMSAANPAKAREVIGWEAKYQMRDVVRCLADAYTPRAGLVQGVY